MGGVEQSAIDAASRLRNLIQSAESTKVSDLVPLERYYRSMLEMNRMATAYLRDGNLEKGLILLVRFCSFVMEELPKHPKYNSHDSVDKRAVLNLVKPTLEKAEEVKRDLKNLYEQDAVRISRLLEAHRMEEMRMQAIKEEADRDRRSREQATRAAEMVQPRNRADQENQIIDPGVNTDSISFSGLNPGPSGSSMATKIPESVSTLSLEDASPFSNNKTLAVAGDLIDRFTSCAAENTQNNIETCGILCGSVVKDRFIISHIVIPKQRGTSDGCFAEGEAEVFEVQRHHELLTLGWIHTHPSQSAFLSSVDLHTHHAYQSAMTQAIAIVIAPKHNQVGTFVLTEEGMQTVGSCSLKGFHPHPESVGQLFREATHVVFSNALKVVMLDLRET